VTVCEQHETQVRKVRGEETGTQCIQRSFSVMRLLASASRQGLKLVDVASALDLSHPTAHRILKALENEGVVERVRGSRRYTIGSETTWLGLVAAERFPITAAAAPVLEKLSSVVGDSVFLAVPSLNESVYADRRLGSYPVQTTTLAVGTRRPMGLSVAGRAMMAFMPDRKVDTILTANSRRFESYGCNSETVLEGMRQTRMRGYLYAASMTAREKRVISVPVLDMGGAPIAAISVIAQSHRLPETRVPRLVPNMRAAAQDISRVLTERAFAA